ncbi:MAG: GreA/GreB family elongation factor [Pigmentiphaga sp.]|nr:GreA/GreB family elongation factor [Pigmentiphaga sp.]
MWNDRCLNRQDAIVLSRTAEQLMRLADVETNVGEALTEIVAQARILPEGDRATAYVELNDRLTYEMCDTGARQTVTLVAPDEAEPRAGKISFVSPVGLAVLGMPVGAEAMVWLPDGRQMPIRIVSTVPLSA